MVKGLGILLMILGHARAPYSDFVILFHMAIFFIVSGYLYNHKYADCTQSAVNYIIRKIKGLWVPYVLYTTIFIILNNIFLLCNIYTDNPDFLNAEGLETQYTVLGSAFSIQTILKEIIKAIFFKSGTQIGGALWFFRVLFFSLIGYNLAEFIIRRLAKTDKGTLLFQTVISVMLLLAGYYCNLKDLSVLLGQVCSVYILIHLGVLIKKYHIMLHISIRCNNICVILISAVILLLGYHRGYISLSNNTIENPVFFLVMSLAGWSMLYSISDLFVLYNFKVNYLLSYISQQSVTIIALHFLCFKIVNYIAVLIYHKEYYMVAAFPVLMQEKGWWILYTMVGIIVPLMLKYLVTFLQVQLTHP